jgi:hypothetical protein
MRNINLDRPTRIPEEREDSFDDDKIDSRSYDSPRVENSFDDATVSPSLDSVSPRSSSFGPNVRQIKFCGQYRMPVEAGLAFKCWDMQKNVGHDCIALQDGNYKCFDSTEMLWKWPRWNNGGDDPALTIMSGQDAEDFEMDASFQVSMERDDSFSPDLADETPCSICTDKDDDLRDDFDFDVAESFDGKDEIYSERSINRESSSERPRRFHVSHTGADLGY